MRLAISNIAWDISEDEAVAELLNRYDIDAIDIAPGKYFPDPVNASHDDIKRVRRWWAEHGIEITGMQALLFGASELNVFGSAHTQEAMLERLAGVSHIAAGLGATRLVFGSPKNRDRSGLTDEEAADIAVPFFERLGDIAASYGVLFCLESNPPRYGANFMTTSAETARVVERVAHRAIRMQLDTGAIAINGEEPARIVARYADLIGHIHASEPDLLPLGDGTSAHDEVYAALAQHLPDHLVCIEMLATKNEPHLQSIERALQAAIRSYRSLLPEVSL